MTTLPIFKIKQWLRGVVLMGCVASCQTVQVEFYGPSEGERLQARMMGFGAAENDTAEFRDLPLSISPDELVGKFVLIQDQDGRQQRWMFPELVGENVKVLVNFGSNRSGSEQEDAAVGEPDRTIDATNRALRLVLRAYQALTRERYQEAIGLGTQAAEIAPFLAAAFIITGMAYYRNGQNQDAAQAWGRARGLDPGDEAIAVLLASVSG